MMQWAAVVPPPLTDQAVDLERVWTTFYWIAVAVGVLVAGLIVFVVIRYRRRGDVLPRQVREHIPLEIAYTVVPLAIVVGLFFVTLASIRGTDRADATPDVVVSVTAFQWSWRFDYTDRGVVETGIEGHPPELVLPAGGTVRFELTSADVVHSFWIPGFRFKRDMFPGQTSEFQVDVGDATGSWVDSGVCAEFCGLDHDKMRFSVRVVDPEEFDAWVIEHQADGPSHSTPETTEAA